MSEPFAVGGFSAIDEQDDPARFFDFLERVKRMPGWVEIKALATLALHVGAGDGVLDVGCGTGADVREIADLVGPTGRAVGVDASALMIDEARRRAGDSNGAIAFEVADASALPFTDGEFDASRTETMLQHLSDPAPAIAELVRVTKPGGQVVAIDLDYGTLVIDSSDHETTQAMVTAHTDYCANGRVGRQLPRLLSTAGLLDITVRTHEVRTPYQVARSFLRAPAAALVDGGTLDADVVRAWWDELAQAETDGVFYASSHAFIVSGRKKP